MKNCSFDVKQQSFAYWIFGVFHKIYQIPMGYLLSTVGQ